MGQPALILLLKSFINQWERCAFKLAGNHTAKVVKELVKPTVEQLGLKLWDVRFVKEGASWYLRIFIDKEGGVTIDDCTDVSHAVDPILDEKDPIDASYYLEVCSPGLNRELKEAEHYLSFLEHEITLTLYKAENGSKTVTGILKDYKDGPILMVENQLKEYSTSEVAKATLCEID